MDYDQEISALKNTVFELLEVNEKIQKRYQKSEKQYKEVYQCLMRKDEVFLETLNKQKTIEELQRDQEKRLSGQINKLIELEDVLEDMA